MRRLRRCGLSTCPARHSARIPARSRQPSGLQARMVVRHRLARRRARATGVTRPLGFQVTFFRVRTGLGEDNPSAFAPRQVLFAHAAIADPAASGRFRHAQRSGRTGFGLVYAQQDDVDVRLDAGPCAARRRPAIGRSCAATTSRLPSTWPRRSRRCCRAIGVSVAKDPIRAPRVTTTACRSCSSAAKSPSTARHARCVAAHGSITNGRAITSIRTPSAGTGSASTCTTAAR